MATDNQSDQASQARSESIRYYMQIFAAVAGILSATIAGISFYFSQSTNGINVSIADAVPLINSEKIQNQNIKIQISVEGTPVERLWLQSIQYENKGRNAVRQNDIQDFTHITIIGKKVVGAQIRAVSPSNFSVDAKIQGNQIILEHGLMNPGDVALIDVFLDGNAPETITCSFRIVNMKECVVSNLISRSQFYLTAIALPSPFREIVVFVSFLMTLFVFGLASNETVKEARRAFTEFRNFHWTKESGISLNDALKRLGIAEEVNQQIFLTYALKNTALENRIRGKTYGEVLAGKDEYSFQDWKLILTNYAGVIRSAINLKTRYYTYGSTEFDALEKSVDSLGDILLTLKQFFYKKYRSLRALSQFAFNMLLLVVIAMIIAVLGGPARTLLEAYFYP